MSNVIVISNDYKNFLKIALFGRIISRYDIESRSIIKNHNNECDFDCQFLKKDSKSCLLYQRNLYYDPVTNKSCTCTPCKELTKEITNV